MHMLYNMCVPNIKSSMIKVVHCMNGRTNKNAVARLEVELVGNADLLITKRLVKRLISVAAAKVERLTPSVLQGTLSIQCILHVNKIVFAAVCIYASSR